MIRSRDSSGYIHRTEPILDRCPMIGPPGGVIDLPAMKWRIDPKQSLVSVTFRMGKSPDPSRQFKRLSWQLRCSSAETGLLGCSAMNPPSSSKAIGLLAYDDMQALDLTGPLRVRCGQCARLGNAAIRASRHRRAHRRRVRREWSGRASCMQHRRCTPARYAADTGWHRQSSRQSRPAIAGLAAPAGRDRAPCGLGVHGRLHARSHRSA